MMLFQTIYSRLSSANVEAKEESLFLGGGGFCTMWHAQLENAKKIYN